MRQFLISGAGGPALSPHVGEQPRLGRTSRMP